MFLDIHLKKKTRAPITDDDVIYDLANTHSNYLRKLQDILSPTIIVCGRQVVLNVAENLIYSNLTFIEVNTQ